ncbi:MAG: hypothetical protein M9921_00315 [Fimbriimonadaceae bacterium]|nr:hypothetical protein [Chthonomonadaceae bacterium]MCO5295278.1 hypothetical protein [Fimbriimonadaceae bacterium]
MEVTPFNSQAYFGTKPIQPKSDLNSTQFIKLLTVQLSNQNPLEPMNDRDFFAQLAQLGTVDGLDKMKKSMDMTQAAGMIGKTVTGVRPGALQGSANQTYSGIVERVTLKNGEQVLGVREANGGLVEAPLGSLQSISE